MREVVITDSAKEDIEFIVSVLENRFSNRVKVEFLVKISEKLLLIENMPFMYPVSQKNSRVRRCIIHKNTSMFYEVSDNLISILAVSDNRIDPESNRF